MMKIFILMIFMFFMFMLYDFYLIYMYMLIMILLIIFFMMNFYLDNLYYMLYYNFSMNNISYYLVLLSLWILMLMYLSLNFLKLNMNLKYLMFLMYSLFMILLMFFYSMNIFLMYIWFEISLVPMIMIILLGGSSIDRIYASMYLIIYTLIVSLPLMLILFYMFYNFGSLEFNMLQLNLNLNFIFFMLMNLGFFIKLPMFMIHIWLPKAHVEAPVYGSMILAAILLKMGSYGIYRLLMIFINLYKLYSLYLIILSMIGGILLSFVCLCQIDMKMLVAYSSVVHMGMLLSGMLINSIEGIFGGYLMMLAHGLCSSGLFCLVNIMYERLNTRSILINKGLGMYMIPMMILWFMLCSSNLSSPGSLNLLSEIMLINSIINWNLYMFYLLIFLCFFSAAYSLYLFSYTQHGVSIFNMNYFNLGLVREYMLIFMHWIPLNLLILVSLYL